MRHNILNTLKVLVLAIVLSFGLSYVYAWTAPTANPPAGNVSAPINTSATAQTKAGDFSISGIFSAAKVGIGVASPTNALEVNGIIKTTGLQLTTGAGAGKILQSDSLGNTSWQDAAQATGNGSAIPEMQAYKTAGTYSWTAPANVDRVMVEAVGGGGGSYAGWATGVGGTSSFGGLLTASGGGAGGGTGASGGSGGAGNGGSLNINGVMGQRYTVGYDANGNAVYSCITCLGGLSFLSGGYGEGGSSLYTNGAGGGGYSKGVLSVTPGQTYSITVGAGGVNPYTYYGGKNGNPGLVILYYTPAAPLASNQTFATNGTFTVPAGVTSIKVEAWGAGGAGASGAWTANYDWSASTATYGGGGGSGGYARSTFTVVPGASYSVVVGAGGSGMTGIVGNAGAKSSFGTSGNPVYLSANGGNGGVVYDYGCYAGGCNGLKYCYGNVSALGGTSSTGGYTMDGNAGGPCTQGTAVGTGGVAVLAGGKSFGAGGAGKVYPGGNQVSGPGFPGNNGAVVVSW